MTARTGTATNASPPTTGADYHPHSMDMDSPRRTPRHPSSTKPRASAHHSHPGTPAPPTPFRPQHQTVKVKVTTNGHVSTPIITPNATITYDPTTQTFHKTIHTDTRDQPTPTHHTTTRTTGIPPTRHVSLGTVEVTYPAHPPPHNSDTSALRHPLHTTSKASPLLHSYIQNNRHPPASHHASTCHSPVYEKSAISKRDRIHHTQRLAHSPQTKYCNNGTCPAPVCNCPPHIGGWSKPSHTPHTQTPKQQTTTHPTQNTIRLTVTIPLDPPRTFNLHIQLPATTNEIIRDIWRECPGKFLQPITRIHFTLTTKAPRQTSRSPLRSRREPPPRTDPSH